MRKRAKRLRINRSLNRYILGIMESSEVFFDATTIRMEAMSRRIMNLEDLVLKMGRPEPETKIVISMDETAKNWKAEVEKIS